MVRQRTMDICLQVVILLTSLPSLVWSKSGFLLTMPREVQIGREEKMCFSFHKMSSVDLRLILSTNSIVYLNRSETFLPGEEGCIPFAVPDGQVVGNHVIDVEGGDKNGQTFSSVRDFKVVEKHLVTFIQTDKPVYKPGQTVRFRILTMTADFMPQTDTINFVRIMTPGGIIMKQWRNVSRPSGLVSLKYSLSRELVLGKWKILADINGLVEEEEFEIKEYVLPKFEILIKPPGYLTMTSETVDGEVCAKYTYGQPVKGRLRLNICTRHINKHMLGRNQDSPERPCAALFSEISGCVPFSINSSSLELKNKSYPHSSLELVLMATVFEEVTGVMLKATKNGPEILNTDLMITVEDYSLKYYKPWLPYQFKALVSTPDGKPAPGRKILVKCEAIQLNQTLVSDDMGIVSYFIPRMAEDKVGLWFSLLAVDKKYEYMDPTVHTLTAATKSLHVQPWFSLTESYLKIEPYTEKAKCDETHSTVHVYITNPPVKPFKVFAQISARGTIVHQITEEIHITENNYIDVISYTSIECPVDIRLETDKASSCNKEIAIAIFEFQIKVTSSMSPSSQVLVYYVREDGEMVADAFKLDVERCFRNKVDMSFGSKKEYPGKNTTLTLKAQPGSLCSIGVVDRSIQVLGGKDHVSSQQIWNILSRYDVDLKKSWPVGSYKNTEQYCMSWAWNQGYLEQSVVSSSPLPPYDPYAGPPPDVRPQAPPLPNGMRVRPARYRRQTVFGNSYPGHGWTYRSDYVDTLHAFKLAGLIVMSDLDIETRPCKKVDFYFYNKHGTSGLDPDEMYPEGKPVPVLEEEVPLSKKPTTVRHYFPDIWLWDLETVGDSGEIQLNKTLPGTITEWVGSAICTSPTVGIGVSDPTSIIGFQPFFLSCTLPYSAVRGESIPIQATVFNYLDECLQIRLRMNNSVEFDLAISERDALLCVCGNDAKSHEYLITPKSHGKINITLEAVSQSRDTHCSGVTVINPAVIGIRDALVRQLLVEPEGTEEEYTYSTMACPGDDGFEEFWDIVDLPLTTDYVPDSARGFVAVVGDIMGATYSNLDQLLRVPNGCGEQNMINFVPNIFIMQYLQATNKLTRDIKDSMVEKYLDKGYQRELAFMHSDGSFSAFGERDRQGSTWLTAFVLKSFSEAAQFLDIDESILVKSRNWLKSKQGDNGCFYEVGQVLSTYMQGGLHGTDSNVTMTAFVMGALLKSGAGPFDEAVIGSLSCIIAEQMEDPYTLSLVSYVTSLHDVNSPPRIIFMKKLEAAAITRDGLMHWEDTTPHPVPYRHYAQATTVNIEMTSYALLAYLEEKPMDLSKALSIVRWLTQQRNAQGGFASTQDTVVTLNALALFAEKTYKHGLNLNLVVEGEQMKRSFSLNEDNSLVMQIEPVSVLPNSLTVTATGTGCALFQTTVKYNTRVSSDYKMVFILKVYVTESDIDKHNCKMRSVHICMRYIGDANQTGMAIVSIKMVTGWKVDIDWLRQRFKEHGRGIKKYEVDENRPDIVNFYFDKVTKRRRCFSVEAFQEVSVYNAKDAFVQVYDYYNKDLNRRVFYNIRHTCRQVSDVDTLIIPGVTLTNKENPFGYPLPNSINVDNLLISLKSRATLDAFITEVPVQTSPAVITKKEITESSTVPATLPASFTKTATTTRTTKSPASRTTAISGVEKFTTTSSVTTTSTSSPLHVDRSTPESKAEKPTATTSRSSFHEYSTTTDSEGESFTTANAGTSTVTLLNGDRTTAGSDIERNAVTNGRTSTATVYGDHTFTESEDKTTTTTPTPFYFEEHGNSESELETFKSTSSATSKGASLDLEGSTQGSENTTFSGSTSVKSTTSLLYVDQTTPEFEDKTFKSSTTVTSSALNEHLTTQDQHVKTFTSSSSAKVTSSALNEHRTTQDQHVKTSTSSSSAMVPSSALNEHRTTRDQDVKAITSSSSATVTSSALNEHRTTRDQDVKAFTTSSTAKITSTAPKKDRTTLNQKAHNTPSIATVTTISMYKARRGAKRRRTRTGKISCPYCKRLKEGNIVERFCKSKAAYKVMGGSFGYFKAKVLADIRPNRKIPVRRAVTLTIPRGCRCDAVTKLTRKSSIALLLPKRLKYISDMTNVSVGGGVVVVRLNKKLEKRLHVSKRRECTKR